MAQRVTWSRVTTLDGTGAGRIDAFPTGGDWVIARATVSTSSATKQPTADLYRNTVAQAGRIDGTFTGAKDTAGSLGTFAQGESLICLWSGGDAGATATLRLDVIQYAPGTGPPDADPYAPFTNSVVGGTALVRTAINSPNYAAGISGWSINADGTSEFNNGTFRGSLAIGTSPNPRWVVTSTIPPELTTYYASIGPVGEAALLYVNATDYTYEANIKGTSAYTARGIVIAGTVHESSTVFWDPVGLQILSDIGAASPSGYDIGDTLRAPSAGEFWRINHSMTLSIIGPFTIDTVSQGRGLMWRNYSAGVTTGATPAWAIILGDPNGGTSYIAGRAYKFEWRCLLNRAAAGDGFFSIRDTGGGAALVFDHGGRPARAAGINFEQTSFVVLKNSTGANKFKNLGWYFLDAATSTAGGVAGSPCYIHCHDIGAAADYPNAVEIPP